MKRFLIVAAVAAATITIPAFAADAEGSPSVGQLNICGYPQSEAIYRQPRVIESMPINIPPVYLRVPLRYTKHWSRHCCKNSACGGFFVRTITASRSMFHVARKSMVIAGMSAVTRAQG